MHGTREEAHERTATSSAMPLRRAVRKKHTIAIVLFAALCFFLLRRALTEHICPWLQSSGASAFCGFGTTHSDWDLFYHLGGNGPWIPKQDAYGNVDDPLPTGCVVDQVHMVWTNPRLIKTIDV